MFNKNSKNDTISITIDEKKAKLVKMHPKKFQDIKAIANEILDGNAVVVELNEMSSSDAIRMVDFLTGVLFVVNGCYKKLSKRSYLLSPSKGILNKFIKEFNK